MGIDSSIAISASAVEAPVSSIESAPEPKRPAKIEPKKVEERPEPKENPKVQAKPIERDEAEKVATEVQAALNRNSQTVVQFNVELIAGDGKENSFKFQVVDRETGKVIRQFPPEDIMNVRDRLKADPPKAGALVDSEA